MHEKNNDCTGGCRVVHESIQTSSCVLRYGGEKALSKAYFDAETSMSKLSPSDCGIRSFFNAAS